MDNIIPLAITGVVLLIGGLVAFRIFVPKLVRCFALRKASEGERDAFSYKQALLENADVVRFYAPDKSFMKEIDADQKARRQAAWLSTYPRAVRAANVRTKPKKSAKAVVLARTQVASAASFITVETLPEILQPYNEGPEHFFIKLPLNGQAEAKVKALAASIKAQLKLHSLTVSEANEDFGSLVFEAHEVAPTDRLMFAKPGTEFFEQNPAKSPALIPLALKANGEVWSLPTHHTLIHGTTGSGKGSPIQGIIRQLEPFIQEGIVQLIGIDPKNAELKPYIGTSLFAGIAVGENEEMADMILRAHALMKTTQDSIIATPENDFGRTVPFSRETPLRLVIIDEFLSLLSALKTMKGDAGKATQRLLEILAQGRSGNMFVIAATQAATKELMGDMRDNFNNKLVLRLESGNGYWNDMWLGDGAAARGFDAVAIRPSSSSNGYATAGIGFVKEETGDPARVRFGYTGAADLEGLLARNPQTTSAPLFDAEPQTFGTSAEDGEDLEWGFSDIEIGEGK